MYNASNLKPVVFFFINKTIQQGDGEIGVRVPYRAHETEAIFTMLCTLFFYGNAYWKAK